MLILSLDSASHGCSAAVWRDGKVLAENAEYMERGQDQRLMPLIMDTMKQAAVPFNELDRIAVTRGPGSFTGLRIGLAAARGIGLASTKPVVGIDRFAIFHARNMAANKNLLVILQSKRKELFCRFYPPQGDAPEATMMTPDEIQPFLEKHPGTLVTGDVKITSTCEFREMDIKEVIVAAALAAEVDIHDLAYLPRPLYLRAPDVTMAKPLHPAKESRSHHA